MSYRIFFYFIQYNSAILLHCSSIIRFTLYALTRDQLTSFIHNILVAPMVSHLHKMIVWLSYIFYLCRFCLVLYWPLQFTLQQHIILLIGFLGPFAFIWKLFLCCHNYVWCKTQRYKLKIESIKFPNLLFSDYSYIHGCQIVEPFTAHYVFALGVSRFLTCAHWVLQVWSVDICWFIIFFYF